MWITGKQIGNAWKQTREFLKSEYHKGTKLANMIDGYASLFKRSLSAAAPMLQDLQIGEALGFRNQGIIVPRYNSKDCDGSR